MRDVLVPYEHNWRRASSRLDAVGREWGEFWTWLTDWPPDMFAVTSALLEYDSIYRLMVSPDPRLAPFVSGAIAAGWPNQQEWLGEVRVLARAWRSQLESAYSEADPAFTPPLDPLLRGFFADCSRHLEALTNRDADDPVDHTALTHLFALHAVTDEACAGLGIPGAPNPLPSMAQEAELLLMEAGSLSRFAPRLVRVLPKLRTPQRGLTLRSFSHHVAVTRTDVAVHWSPSPPPNYVADDDCERLEILVLPWPLDPNDIRIVPSPLVADPWLPPGWGYFDFDIAAELPVERVIAAIQAARARAGGTIHGVLFPEAALTEAEFDRLTQTLDDSDLDVRFVLAGLRGLERNRARLQIFGNPPVDQDKHHRWCVDGGQIEQYGLHGTLNQHRQWWEHIELPPRRLTFVPASGWLTMCHVICEDLARLDPIDQVIRAVAPTLLVALLQDGPQLRTRWPGKFATVYADDPGCSVLTITSRAMARKFQSKHVDPDRGRVVALWSEPGGYPKELELADGADGLWLSIQAARVTEYTADGRSDEGWAARLMLRTCDSIVIPASEPLTER